MIHLYWHTDPPEQVRNAADQWRELTDHDVAIWTPAQLRELHERAQAAIGGVHPPDHVRHLANVSRWALLAEHGGMWADTDVWPLRSPADYLNRAEPWCASIGSLPTPFICGGPAGHPLWTRTLDIALDNPQGTSPGASGGRLLGEVARIHELELVPAALFSEHDATGDPLPVPDGGRYSTHEWRTSFQRFKAYR